MAINNLNNLNENMALLKEKFSSMYAEIANIKNLYADMRQEAEDSYIESQRHWNKRAYEEQSRVFSQAGEKIAQVDKMINGLDNLEKQLCIVDKSYAKRRDNQAFAVDLELDIADSDIFDKFKSLHDEAVAIAKDCSLTVKVQPIQELGMLISNKRKLKYERLFSLLAQTKLMRGKLLEQLNRENDGMPVGFKVAFCNPENQEQILNEVEQRYSLMETKEKTLVFSGDSVPQISDSMEFQMLHKGVSKNVILLGEPIKIDNPVKINISRTKRSNLLIVGSNQEMLDQLVALYVLNVLESTRDSITIKEKSVYLIDGLTVLGETPGNNVKSIMDNHLLDMRVAKNNYDIVDMIDDLYVIYEERKEARLDNASNNEYEAIHVLLNNVQWLEVINLLFANKSITEFVSRPETHKNKDTLFGYLDETSATLSLMDDFLEEMNFNKKNINVSYAKKLLTLLETGYTYGINFVMTSPDILSIKEYMYDIIPKFTLRMVFGLSNQDADRIIPDARTEQIKGNIVIFYDGIHPAYQMKPYSGIPDYFRKKYYND